MDQTGGVLAAPARYAELDSLRGLAALTVFVCHVAAVWATNTQITSSPVRWVLILTAPFAQECVILFFVLSGFVLSMPAVSGRPQSYLAFTIRRVFRIYVPYLAALAVSVAGAFWLHGLITKSVWLHASWTGPVNWHLVGQHVLFLGLYNTPQFDPPIWSLIHEMRISLVFPFLCAFVLRFRSRWSLPIAIGFSVIASVLAGSRLSVNWDLAGSVHYAAFFILGIYLARERERLGERFHQWSRFAMVNFGAVCLILLLFAGPIVAICTMDFFNHSVVYQAIVSCWITALGAGGIIIIGISSGPCRRVLCWPPVHFVGRISYSLYLWHFVVTLYCFHLLYGKMPLDAIICLCLVLSIVVSWCSYRCVELPSMNLGRRLSSLPGFSWGRQPMNEQARRIV